MFKSLLKSVESELLPYHDHRVAPYLCAVLRALLAEKDGKERTVGIVGGGNYIRLVIMNFSQPLIDIALGILKRYA